ncbi:MAG: acylphosphatase, partial [Gemmatimonadota bacterium]
ASGLGVVGTVRNLDDGRVEVVADGNSLALALLRKVVQGGSRSAVVSNVENADILVDMIGPKSFIII